MTYRLIRLAPGSYDLDLNGEIVASVVRQALSDLIEAKKVVYAETHGRLKQWAALTELPVAGLALARNGYVNLQQAGPGVWQIALTESGQTLATSCGS